LSTEFTEVVRVHHPMVLAPMGESAGGAFDSPGHRDRKAVELAQGLVAAPLPFRAW